MDLLVPPLTYVALATFVGLSASITWLLVGRGAWWALVPWSVSMTGLLVYVVRGVWLSRVGPRAVLDLLWAPVYMIWKVALALRASPARATAWVRTTREGEKP
jgi:hypothetical protein